MAVISFIDELEYWFDKKKDWYKYKSKQFLTETDLKKRFQTLFQNTENSQGRNLQNEIFEVIWAKNTGGVNNKGLRGSLFPRSDYPQEYDDDQYKEAAKVTFQRLINTLDNKLFGFIKVK